MGFADDIKKWELKALEAANTSVCKAFEKLGVNLVDLTGNGNINIGGYSNGDIANNWHVSVGALTTVVPNAPDLAGTASLSRIKSLTAARPFYGKDNVVFLTNVMNYSYRADKVGWPMGQGTNGWVWSGRVPAYGFTSRAVNNLKGAYI
jgi:hypothetical protein